MRNVASSRAKCSQSVPVEKKVNRPVANFLDEENNRIYNKYFDKYSKKEISSKIEEEINLTNVLENSFKDFDGGYALAGLVGHGSSFIARDPSGIRPLYYYVNDEIIVSASERPPIKTAFGCDFSEIKENICSNNPVEKHFILGNSLGVSGTPSIITSEGRLIPGYIPPEELIGLLSS